MAALAYGAGLYRRNALGLPELRARNLYIERTPVTGEQPVLVGRPGMIEARDDGAAAVRGLFQWDGVLGSRLISFADVVRVDGASVGSVAGTDNVRAAAGEGEVLAVSDGSLLRVTTSSVSTVAFPDGAAVGDVAFLRGRFLVVRRDTGQFYWSEILDGANIDGLSFATAEKQADPLVGCLVVGDEVWLFGTRTVEPWGPNSDADLPFAPTPGRIFSVGCAARDTIAALDNNAYWVTHERQVVRGGPTVPEIISTPSIAERLADVEASALSAWAFTMSGHAFYVLRIDGVATLAYDVSTGEWMEWDTYGSPCWDAHVGVNVGPDVYAGSQRDGMIWRLRDDVYTDDGVDIVREFTAIAPVSGAETVAVDSLEVGAFVGGAPLGVVPEMEVARSRDGGFSWSEWRAAPMGSEGQFRTRCVWRRLGQVDAPGTVFRFRVSHDAPLRISGVRVNEAGGGRSRG